MSHTYTPTPTLFDDVILPDDGDDEDAASVNVPFEKVADGLAFVSKPASDPAESPALASRSLNTAQLMGHVWSDPSQWGQVTAKPSIVQLSGTATYIAIDLKFPHGCTVTEFYIYLTGGGSHIGLPATMPSWTIYERDPVTGVDTSLDSRADTSASVPAYESYHFVGHHVSVPFVVDREKRYWVLMNGEGSTNALAGLIFEGMAATVTVTSQDVGAS